MAGILMYKQVVHIVIIIPLIYSYSISTIPKQTTADADKQFVPIYVEIRGQRGIIHYGV
jgi:hypothetical protein